MGRPAAAGGGYRGGESIPALRTLQLRLAAAGAAAVLAAGLAAYPVLHAGRLAPLTGALGAIGLLCVLTALVGGGRLAGPALFALATEYTIVEATGHSPAASVIGYAAGLIVVSELLLWSAQLPRSAAADRAVAAGRLALLIAIALAATLLALAVLAAADLRLPGALAAALLGTAAAVVLLALPWLLLRRPDSPAARQQPADAPGSEAPAPGAGGQAT